METKEVEEDMVEILDETDNSDDSRSGLMDVEDISAKSHLNTQAFGMIYWGLSKS